MGVPTSEVGYTAAMPRRGDHEVHKGMWWTPSPPPKKKQSVTLTRTDNELPEDGVTVTPKHVGAVFNVNFNIVFKTIICVHYLWNKKL